MPLINCEVSLTLNWSENRVLTSTAYSEEVSVQGDNPKVDEINAPANATFKLTDTKLYVPVVTLSTKNNNKLSEQLKTGF